jgi:hypothetical protein
MTADLSDETTATLKTKGLYFAIQASNRPAAIAAVKALAH